MLKLHLKERREVTIGVSEYVSVWVCVWLCDCVCLMLHHLARLTIAMVPLKESCSLMPQTRRDNNGTTGRTLRNYSWRFTFGKRVRVSVTVSLLLAPSFLTYWCLVSRASRPMSSMRMNHAIGCVWPDLHPFIHKMMTMARNKEDAQEGEREE